MRSIPFIALAAIYAWLRINILNFQDTLNFYGLNCLSFKVRVLTFFKSIAWYFGMIIFPYQLRVERNFPWCNHLRMDVIFGIVITASLIAIFIFFIKKNPMISFGVGWFFIALAPMSNLINVINSTFYEHFMYLPLMGISIAIFSYKK